jgi:hypothetical protein
MSRKRRPDINPVVLSQEPRELSDSERRLILDVADVMVYEAGRTTLALALRGSKNQKLARFKVDDLAGYGMYRGLPEDEVLARIDQLVRDGILAIEASRDGFPLLAYTPQGLELAETFAAERWLGLMREHLGDNEPFHPPFAYDLMPNRNNKTLNRVLDALETEADAAWLPMLREWSACEVKKVRARLAPLIERLEGKHLGGGSHG